MHLNLRMHRRWLMPSALTLGVTFGVIAVAGCGDDDDNNGAPTTTDGGTDTGPIQVNDTGTPDANAPGDNGTITSVTAATAPTDPNFTSPFDSTPDPTGVNIYFTAIATVDGTSGVFKVPVGGGASTTLFSGDPLVSPLGIAITSDGSQLFIADPSANTDNDIGQIYVLPAAGGTPTPFGGTEGYQPKSVVIVGPDLYFTGVDKTSGAPGVFKVAVTGGAIATIASGAPIVDPSGVTASIGGDVFFVDTSSSASSKGVVYKVPKGGTPSPIHPEYGVGYPAGLALSGDGTALLASAISQDTYTDEVHRIDVGSGQATINATGAIGTNIEAAGLHRAANANVYSWVDSLAGGNGAIYVLK